MGGAGTGGAGSGAANPQGFAAVNGAGAAPGGASGAATKYFSEYRNDANFVSSTLYTAVT